MPSSFLLGFQGGAGVIVCQDFLVAGAFVGQVHGSGLAHAHPVPPAADSKGEGALLAAHGEASAAQTKGFPQFLPSDGFSSHGGGGHIAGRGDCQILHPFLLRTGEIQFVPPGGLSGVL